MADASIPLLHLEGDLVRLAGRLGASFREHGFALVTGHGIDAALIDAAWDHTRQLFALDEETKRQYHVPGLAGARGYTAFGTEIAKGASARDLKEFWHVGRDLPPVHALAAAMPDNVWPAGIAGFRDTFTRLFAEFDRVGTLLLSFIALDLGLPAKWFESATADGNSVLRLLHYPPVAAPQDAAIRAGPHEDINLITLLLGAEEAGLELLGKDAVWRAVSPPRDALVVNIGDMLQRLTNHILPSTTHRVVNPRGAAAARSRYAMPFFLHLRSDFVIRSLPQCVTPANPDRYPEAITADAFLQDRLREIGLRG